jgi:tetratricopeptide (TPR) repeat protein
MPDQANARQSASQSSPKSDPAAHVKDEVPVDSAVRSEPAGRYPAGTSEPEAPGPLSLNNSQTLKELQALELERVQAAAHARNRAAGLAATLAAGAPDASAMLDVPGADLVGSMVIGSPQAASRAAWLHSSLTLGLAIGLGASLVYQFRPGHSDDPNRDDLGELQQEVKNIRKELSQAREKLELVEVAQSAEHVRMIDYVQGLYRQLKEIEPSSSPELRQWKEQLIRHSLPVVEQIIQAQPDGGRGEALKMIGLFELAALQRERGHCTQAAGSIAEALALAEQRLARHPDAEAGFRDVSLLLGWQADLHSEMNQEMAGALRGFQEAIDMAEELMRRNQTTTHSGHLLYHLEACIALADSHQKLARTRLRLGDAGSARRNIAAASLAWKQLAEKLAGTPVEPPNSKPLQTYLTEQQHADFRARQASAELVDALILAEAFYQEGRHAEATATYRQLTADIEVQRQAAPDDAQLVLLGITAQANWALVQYELNDRDAGLELLRQAAERSQQLLQEHGTRADARRCAAWISTELALRLAATNPEQAESWGAAALQLHQELADGDPDNNRYQLEQMVSQAAWGDTTAAVATARRFLKAEQSDADMLMDVAAALVHCGGRVPDQSQDLLQQAQQALERAVRLGWRDALPLNRNLHLQPLQSLPDFQALTQRLVAAPASTSQP